MTLPELAALAIQAGCLICSDDHLDCPPNTPCKLCPMWDTPTSNRCLLWSRFQADYQQSTLTPYLRTHHPELFI